MTGALSVAGAAARPRAAGSATRPRCAGENIVHDAWVRRRPHAPGVHQAVDRRVRARRPAARDDGGAPPTRTSSPTSSASRAIVGADGGRRAAAVHLRRLRLELRAGVAASSPPARRWTPATSARSSSEHGAIGVAEVMNFPGVIAGDPEMLARIARGRRTGGSTATRPGLAGRALDAYLAAGVESDHECTRARGGAREAPQGHVGVPPPGLGEPEPARARSPCRGRARAGPGRVLHGRPRAGHAAARSATSTTARGWPSRAGVPEVDALLLACTNPARYHGFTHLGALGPGHQADVLRLRRARLLAPGARLAGGPARGGRRRDARRRGARRAGPGRAARHGARRRAARRGATSCSTTPAGTRVRAVGVEAAALTTPRAARSCSATTTSPTPRWSSATAGRAGSAAATRPASACGAARSRRPSPTTPTTSSSSARSTAHDMAVAVARLAEIGGGQVAVLDGRVLAEVAAAARRPDERPAGGRGRRRAPRAQPRRRRGRSARRSRSRSCSCPSSPCRSSRSCGSPTAGSSTSTRSTTCPSSC